MAQCLHESGKLRYSEELASGSAYEGRKDLGNINPGDGVLFKGRGFIQITGRITYMLYGKYLGIDIITGENPKKVGQPELCADSAGWFWAVFKKDKNGNNLNVMADDDSFLKITYFVNGGFNGIKDRLSILKKAYSLFGVDNIDHRMNYIYTHIEENIKNPNRSGSDTALFKTIPDLKALNDLKA